MLRQRLRALEVELSDIDFESRRKVTSSFSANQASAAVSQKVEGPSFETSVDSVASAKLVPKAPRAPAPQHIHLQRRLEELQLQMNIYERERSSVRKLLGIVVRRWMCRVGEVLNFWSPVYNLMLWGELRREGIRV